MLSTGDLIHVAETWTKVLIVSDQCKGHCSSETYMGVLSIMYVCYMYVDLTSEMDSWYIDEEGIVCGVGLT